eukprot:16437806-Heterocapsa_arctica.AAC.1
MAGNPGGDATAGEEPMSQPVAVDRLQPGAARLRSPVSRPGAMGCGPPGPVPRTEAEGSRALPEGSDPRNEGGCALLPDGWGAGWPPGPDRSVQ